MPNTMQTRVWYQWVSVFLQLCEAGKSHGLGNNASLPNSPRSNRNVFHSPSTRGGRALETQFADGPLMLYELNAGFAFLQHELGGKGLWEENDYHVIRVHCGKAHKFLLAKRP